MNLLVRSNSSACIPASTSGAMEFAASVGDCDSEASVAGTVEPTDVVVELELHPTANRHIQQTIVTKVRMIFTP